MHGWTSPPHQATEIISHCGWLYFRFCLSFRDVREMMLERGIEVSHEAIRLWTLKFGAEYARRLRRRIGRYGDTWHLDEVFCKVNGELVYLWRAVDQEGETLDVLVQKAAQRQGGEAFLPKATEGFTLQSARNCHRQALKLHHGAPRDDARN